MTTPVTALDQRYSGATARASSWQFGVQDGCFRHPGGGLAVVFAVRPAKVFAHAKGEPFGATTHRFQPSAS